MAKVEMTNLTDNEVIFSEGDMLEKYNKMLKMHEEVKRMYEEIQKEKIDPRIQYVCVRNVKDPKRANRHDAATDFYVPEYDEDFIKVLAEENKGTGISYYRTDDTEKEVWKIVVPARTSILIPSGIKVNILDKRTYLDVKNKGGIATNFGLIKTAQVIDSNFQDEMFYALFNTKNEAVEIWTGMKIIQLLHQRYIDSEYEKITNDDYAKIEKSERGEGKRGSSGLN